MCNVEFSVDERKSRVTGRRPPPAEPSSVPLPRLYVSGLFTTGRRPSHEDAPVVHQGKDIDCFRKLYRIGV